MAEENDRDMIVQNGKNVGKRGVGVGKKLGGV
jgi:hypothetical protein